MLFMFGQNKRTNMGRSSQHDLTLSLFRAVEKVSVFLFTLRLGSGVTHSPGYRVAQVCVVFEIPTKIISEVFRSVDPPPMHLAYIE